MREGVSRALFVTAAIALCGLVRGYRWMYNDHEVSFVNDRDTPVEMDVRLSDDSASWQLELAPGESQSIQFLPELESHLEVSIEGHATDVGYFAPTTHGRPVCFVIHIGDPLVARTCDD